MTHISREKYKGDMTMYTQRRHVLVKSRFKNKKSAAQCTWLSLDHQHQYPKQMSFPFDSLLPLTAIKWKN